MKKIQFFAVLAVLVCGGLWIMGLFSGIVGSLYNLPQLVQAFEATPLFNLFSCGLAALCVTWFCTAKAEKAGLTVPLLCVLAALCFGLAPVSAEAAKPKKVLVVALAASEEEPDTVTTAAWECAFQAGVPQCSLEEGDEAENPSAFLADLERYLTSFHPRSGDSCVYRFENRGSEIEIFSTGRCAKLSAKKRKMFPNDVFTLLTQAGADHATKRGAHPLKLERNYTASELHAFLKSKRLKGAELDACWRGNTVGIMDAMMTNPQMPARAYAQYDLDVTGQHAPVIWSGFTYRPEVVQARKRDQYTGVYADYKLACQSAGQVTRWDPYQCASHGERTAWFSGKLDGRLQSDCEAPAEDYPTFRKGQAVWVTNQ